MVTVTQSARVHRARVVIAAIVSLVAAAPPAFATYGGLNGKIAYTDIVDKGTPEARRAVFLDPGGQFTHPVPYGSGVNDNDTDPAWSPNGKQLAFIRRNGQTQRYGIHVVNADGTGLRLVAGEFNASGAPTYLNGATPSGLSWSPDGLRIGFLARSLIASVAAIGGPTPAFSVPLSGPFSASPINGFDWGPDGFLYRCSVAGFPNTQFCSADELGTVKSVTAIGPDEAPIHLGFLNGIPRWRPDGQGSQKVMFPLVYSKPVGSQSLSRTGIFSLTPALFQAGAYGTGLVRHTPAEETVSCTNTANGVTTTTFSPRYAFSNPIPSPDGRFIVVKRIETVTTTTPTGGCAFQQEGHGLYLLRDTGAVQRTVVASMDVDDAAWQSSPANLTVKVSDGHGNQLDGLKVELHAEVGGALVDDKSVNTAGGSYGFADVQPGNYRIRATLVEKEEQAFEVRHTYPAGEAVWAERQIVVPADVETVEAAFPMDAEHIADSNVGNSGDTALWHRLDDMAVIYYNTRKFVQWVRSNLTESTGPIVPIYTFSPQSPNSNVEAAGALYDASLPGIFISVSNSEYENRDGILDAAHDNDAPMNVEWHEFAHHVGTQAHPDLYCTGDNRISHGGYANRSTCDSMVEGFANFLPAWASRNPDYIGLSNLESSVKAWGSRFDGGGLASTEDFSVAALLWDIVDSNADAEYTVAIAYNGVHLPTTYTDDVSLPLSDLWRILTTTKPRTVRDLQNALSAEPPFATLTIDLDNDGIKDVSQADPLFLMHGFFPVSPDQSISAGHQSWHYNVADARLNGPPGTLANQDVGLSDHYAYVWPNQVSATFIPRWKTPVASGANLGIQARDASGTPLQAADLELTVHYPGSDQTISRRLGSGDSNLVHLELPVYFDYQLPTGAPLPACNPATDLYVSVTVRATVNGYGSANAPAFDNCQYLQAMVAASGPAALSYTLNFPEDSTAPVTTIATTASGPVLGEYTSGFWTVALSCADPVEGGFAAGCWRIEYSLDGGPFVPYEAAVKITELGLHTFAYRSLDAATNVENARSVNLGVDAFVDTQPPVTTLTAIPSEPAVGLYTAGFWTVTLDCSDLPVVPVGLAGCLYSEYSLDGGPFEPYPDEPVYISEAGLHTVQYRSGDIAGNVEALQSVSLGVTPPSNVDGDGVPDPIDNCTLVANPTQLDADGDGYGNICDADLDNSGLVTSADYIILRNALLTANPVADLNGSGLVTSADYTILRNVLLTAPGPSGLACAGTIPCP